MNPTASKLISPNFEPTLLIEGPFGGQLPDPKYWLAVRAAKKLIGTISKDKELPKNAGKKAGRKFSSYNDWIDQCEPHLDSCGLVFQQSSSIVQFPSFPGGPPSTACNVIKFLMVHAETGTGMIYRMDWPLWGFQGPAPDDRGAALGYAIKYGLRGILNISQSEAGADEVSKQTGVRYQGGQQQQTGAYGGPHYGNQQQPPQQNGQQQRFAARAASGMPPNMGQPYGQQPPPQQGIDFRQHMNQGQQPPPPQQSMGRTYGQQQPPQQSMGRTYGQQQPPSQSVNMDPVVQEAHAQLGPHSPPAPAPEPFQAPAAQDGNMDPVFEDLMAVGWNEDLARNIASIPADEPVPEDLGLLFHDAVVNEYFMGDHNRANAPWLKDDNGPATGFVPQPDSGIMPTGAQIRRYCVKLNWNTPQSTARTGA